LGCWKGKKEGKEQAIDDADVLIPRESGGGRPVRALPDAAVAVSRYGLAVWSFTIAKYFNFFLLI
jgi:hypothetical protein